MGCGLTRSWKGTEDTDDLIQEMEMLSSLELTWLLLQNIFL